jgi:hypothetical protein
VNDDYVCTNQECGQVGVPKANPYGVPDDMEDVLCGECGQPCEARRAGETRERGDE